MTETRFERSPMTPFEYLRIDDAGKAVAAVAERPGAAFLAGGTTLLDLMKLNVVAPEQLVDINRTPLATIDEVDGGLRIGALARNTTVAYDERVRTQFPALAEAILSGASPQIRNMASVGGNLMQRTRCYYFRDGVSPCNKRLPGSMCSARDGFNRMHAIFANQGKCVATNPSDMCVALAAYEAVILLRGATDERRVPIREFYLPYGEDPACETVLAHGELITGVELRTEPWYATSRYVKVRDRESFEFALTSAAVALRLDGGKVAQARVALGGVASVPWRSAEAEAALTGQAAGEATWQAAAEAALRDAKPLRYNAFKVELAKRTIVRALTLVAAGG
jgi:xanthine dehydrogenase YagS FAD-binding subunit